MKLSTRIVLLVLLNIGLLAACVLAFASARYGMDWRALLLAASEERILTAGRMLALELEGSSESRRNDVARRYSDEYGVRFYLFLNDGAQMAGPSVTLPDEVRRRMRGGPQRVAEPPLPPPPRGEPPRMPVFLVSAGGQYWVGVRTPFQGERATMFLVSDSLLGGALFIDPKPWIAAALVFAAVGFACWYPFLRGVTRTIREITGATEQISHGRFDVALPEKRSDELGQLSIAIHRMANRLSELLNGQKRFLGDVAHELSSPIARMQFAVAALETRVDEQTFTDLREEVQSISTLVGELLQFTKAGLQKKPLASVNLSEAARRAVEREGAAVEIGIDTSLHAMADREALERALGNLIRNAVRYAGGEIEVAARRQNGTVRLTVSDHGPGIAEEELDRVFAPFYRPEAARTREGGGVGLGLAIVKSCVEACGGTVECRNRTPHGLEVEIRLEAATEAAFPRSAARP